MNFYDPKLSSCKIVTVEELTPKFSEHLDTSEKNFYNRFIYDGPCLKHLLWKSSFENTLILSPTSLHRQDCCMWDEGNAAQ
jgi:hypothetical protein